ncbi:MULTISPECIES: sigma E protease regulator RseP [unclassified Agarivorans]|uniref:sigma E protease regulator RseP n=1 Tax=unclassified Agarivorans TaxID=2636026 RepID=UPI0026E279FD|nr:MULTISPECIES: sigma E protease regulator RseP [unclassified Agarivorans]MDO6687377.1 sigma E protease regulator RseP [Agarivorans sp. 3_MG-2023]MDO6717035.1 sigma E protease regulator RseP [Agarivorans sp. 2_MG-2023]
MNEVIWNTSFFIIALGILVTVHEFGHFWVARRCGVKVERFSIGFGKALWRRTAKDGTEYVVAMIPLGGYVKMLDERVAEVPESLRSQAFNNKSLSQRSAVVAAGPIANFLLAILAFWIMFVIGVPSVKPVLGGVVPNSIAEQAGLRSGQEIVQIAGQETLDWESVNLALVGELGGETLPIQVVDTETSQSSTAYLDIRQWQLDSEQQSPILSLGLKPFNPTISLAVAKVVEGKPAANAGIKEGDVLVALDSVSLSSWQDFVDYVQARPEENIRLDISRDGNDLQMDLVPEAREYQGQISGYVGLAPEIGEFPEEFRIDLHYGFVESIGKSLERTWHLSKLTVSMIGKLVTGVVSLDNLSGPISIAKGAGATADYGLVYFLGFVALVSINLGIINLFPLPVLDGGHLVFFAIEGITGKPVSERVQEIGFRIGAVLVMALMSLAIFNDFMRL